MPLTRTPDEVIIDGVDVSKPWMRQLLNEIAALSSGGGGGGDDSNLGAGYDVAYIDFSNKPDGALLSNLTWDTGHTFAGITGPGATTVAVTNTDGSSGYISSPDGTFYSILNWPYKNFVASMLVSWEDDTNGPGMALGCGVYVDGAIIAKMAHAQSNYNLPFLTLWGTGHDTPGQPNLLESYITPQNSFNDREPFPEPLDKVRITVVVIGDYLAFFYNGQHRVKQFYYLGEAGSDDREGAISTLVGEYIYFETTYNAKCRVHDMYAKELTPSDWPQIYPTPVPTPVSSTTPQIVSKSIPKNTKTEITRFTMSPGNSTRVNVELMGEAAGAVDSYAACGASYFFTATRYSDPSSDAVVAGPAQVGSDQKPSANAGTLTLTPTFYAESSGDDVVISAKLDAGGADGSSYSPICTLRVTFTGAAYELEASA